MKIKVIFFDFDGVILESVDIKTAAFVELFKDYPEHIDRIREHHVNNSGVSRFEKIKIYFNEFIQQPLTENIYQTYLDLFSDIVFSKVLKADFVPGTLDFIKSNYLKYDLYVISATPTDEIQKIVQKRKLSKYFKNVFGSPIKKGDWVKKVIEDNHYAAEESVFIGDALSDYKAARENGIHFVGRMSDERINPFAGLDIKNILPDLTSLCEVLREF